MSGITPILDTLLHQVLGKRVDIPVAKDLPEPVSAKTSSDAIQPAHSDSRLNPQSGGTVGPTSRELPAEARPAPDTLAAHRALPASTQLHLSRTATVIADLLDRFPVERQTAIRPQTPLLARPAGDTQAIASALSKSVSESGLFYESHLLRWLEGQLPRGALLREPQAWLGLRFLATTPNQIPLPLQVRAQALPISAASADARDSARPRAGQAFTSMREGKVEGARSGISAGPIGPGAAAGENRPAAREPLTTLMQGAKAALTDDGADGSMIDRHQVGRHSSDVLQSLVRHQLELVVTPELRWEGQPWPNVPMTMLFTPLDGREDEQRDDGPEAQASSTLERGLWQTRIDLEFPHLGMITLRLQATGDGHLHTCIEPVLAESRRKMSVSLGGLQTRLDALGASVELSSGAEDE